MNENCSGEKRDNRILAALKLKVNRLFHQINISDFKNKIFSHGDKEIIISHKT